jgi:peptide/nickel transport system ATP-binding protein
MSGGMRQRVMIAMALACKPELLIADEPTTALDVTIQAQILDLIYQLRDELNMGVLFITHDLGVVSEVADRVVVMYCGQVVEEANKMALFEKPLHPYTLGLLESIPRVEDDESKRLFTIPGTVPNPLDMPSGCPFSTRCNRCMERCRKERPQLKPVPGVPGRRVRCFLYDDGEATAAEPTAAPTAQAADKREGE